MYANYEDPEADREAEIAVFAKEIESKFRERQRKGANVHGDADAIREMLISKLKKENWIKRPTTHDY